VSKDIVHIEWHLTPRGWVREGWSINRPFQSSSLPPLDRVETWVTTETAYDMQFAKTQREWSLAWASSQHSDAEGAALRASVRGLGPASDTAQPPPQDFPLN